MAQEEVKMEALTGPETKAHKATVLVVDDEDLIRYLLERLLLKAGYGVITANNGLEALNQLAQGNVDLVLLDIKMPGLDGFQTLKIMRRECEVPIIMLTGKGELSALQDTLSLGADDYIRKPFNTPELVARIGAKLRRSARRSNLAQMNVQG
jgi:DNA-binding response OmpR family regulator